MEQRSIGPQRAKHTLLIPMSQMPLGGVQKVLGVRQWMRVRCCPHRQRVQELWPTQMRTQLLPLYGKNTDEWPYSLELQGLLLPGVPQHT